MPFGILVGGSEELLHMAYGKENIYILERKGFIKYALQHGCVRARGTRMAFVRVVVIFGLG